MLLVLLNIGFSASLKLDSTSTTPSIIKPGVEVDLTAKVQNIVISNEDSKYSYNLELIPKGSLSENNIIIIDGDENTGILGSNEIWNSKFKFKVKEGSSSGTYEFYMYINKMLNGVQISQTQAIIDFQVVGDTFFKLSSNQSGIEQGMSKTFESQIKNVGGGSAGSITLTFGNTKEIQVIGTNSFYFDNIKNSEAKNFNVTLHASDNIASGTYNFPVTIKYNDGVDIKTQVIEVGVLVGGNIDLRVASIETTPKEVKPGDNFVLVSVNLENAGDDAAKSISTYLKSDEFSSSYSNNNLAYAGRIDSGSYSNLKFYINIPKDSNSGVYNTNLNINYMNLMGDTFDKELKVPIFIKEKPMLEITNVEAVGKSGSDIQVKFNVINNGEEDAQEVDVRLISDSALPFTIEERSVYLGSIKTNSNATAIFTVKASSDAQINDYNIKVFLRARGDSEIGDNNIYTYNKDLTISIDSKSINKLLITGIIITLIVIIGLIFNRKKTSKKSISKK